MKSKTLFLILGAAFGLLLAKRLWDRMFPDWTITAQSVFFSVTPGKDIHQTIKKLIEAANGNELRAICFFNGHQIYADPGETHSLIWDRYLWEEGRENREADAKSKDSPNPKEETETGRPLTA